MNRFFGMMPSSEIQMEKNYKDGNGLNITIQAGLHGWTILWADSSSTYEDIDATTEDNFKTAYDKVVESIGPITEIERTVCSEK